jgi:hypothetical protein
MTGLRPLYCKHCGQTLLSDDLAKCSACGKMGGMIDPADEAGYLGMLVAQKQAEPEPAAREMGRQIFRGYIWLRLVVPALVMIALGISMVVFPDLRDNPRKISFGDVVRAVITIFAGFVLIGLVFLYNRRGK